MSIFTDIEEDFERFWENHVKPFINQDVEPVLKIFIQQFNTKFGAQALTEALAAVGKLSEGAAFGETATELAATLYSDAKSDAATSAEADATQILQTVQAALQVAKNAQGVITPADKTAAQGIELPTE